MFLVILGYYEVLNTIKELCPKGETNKKPET